MIPFLILGAARPPSPTRSTAATKLAIAAETKKTEVAQAAPVEEPMSAALKMDDLKIELGYALLAAGQCARPAPTALTEQIKALRRSLAIEMGFVMPRRAHPRQRPARRHVMSSRSGGRGRHGKVVARPIHGHGSGRQSGDAAGVHTTEPTFVLPRNLDRRRAQEEASVKGYTVVDAATVLATHLTELSPKPTCRSCCPTARCRN